MLIYYEYYSNLEIIGLAFFSLVKGYIFMNFCWFVVLMENSCSNFKPIYEIGLDVPHWPQFLECDLYICWTT